MKNKESATQFQRRLILEDRVNAGESIKGITGYVPAITKCCTGGTTCYIPVIVEGVKLGDCEFSVLVHPTSKDVLCLKDSFTVSPSSFFQSKQEVINYLAHMNRVREYEQAMQSFKYSNSTRLQKRNLFKKAYEESNDADLKETIDEEAKEAGGMSKLDSKLITDYYKALMITKHFPDYGKEFDPEDSDEEYEDGM